MSLAHLYIFSDGCPTDWLVEGQDETWHTIVNYVFQSTPELQSQVDTGKLPHEVLSQDQRFLDFITGLQNQISSRQLRKWNTSPSYKLAFCRAFAATHLTYRPFVFAYSFQEKILRESKDALLNSYNNLIGGSEGRGIGFEEFRDEKGRLHMKHSFVNFFGYHEIEGLENKMLILLLMSSLVAEQYKLHWTNLVGSQRYNFDKLGVTVVSDKLSGDNDFRSKSEQNLRNLIDPEGQGIPVILTRSPKSDSFSADLLVDNLAGWLNTAITDPEGEFGQLAKDIAPTGVWSGWSTLLGHITLLKSTSALSRLIGGTTQ